jgi:hypothetical protein
MVEPVFNDECECDANVRDDKKKPKEWRNNVLEILQRTVLSEEGVQDFSRDTRQYSEIWA